MSTVAAKDFVTVVSVDGGGRGGAGVQPPEDSFVTVLSIGEDDEDAVDGPTTCSGAAATAAEEEVLVYRLPGERLGFGLRFDGVDTCNRLFVQSCADGSPASRTQASWGPLAPGDEIVRINGRPVNRLSRDDCVRCLKESGLVVKLHMVDGRLAVKAPPPVPPRKQKKPEPPPVASSALYTDAVERLFVYHGESESDDTNSSVSTVVSKCPAESPSGAGDCDGETASGGSDKNCVLDRVLEPFMQLEREFSSSAAIGDDVGLYEKLVAVAEEDRGLPPKPLPRKEVRPPKKKPPPPPPPLPSSLPLQAPPLPPPPAYRLPPRLVDFVPKDELPQTVTVDATTAVTAADDDLANDDDDVFAIGTDAIMRPTGDGETAAMTAVDQHDQKKECDETPALTSGGGCEPAADRSYSGSGPTAMKSLHPVQSAESSGRTDWETDSDGSRNFATTTATRRTISGRTDEVCSRSVRDKIAMFSRTTGAAAAVGDKKDSSSSWSSAYSTASADSSPAASPKSSTPAAASYYSTLPRKPSQQHPATARPLWGTPAAATTVQQQPPAALVAADHRRSQSLVEQPYSKYFNTMNAYAEMGRSSLNALIEQRRRSMSKLRGLVIPEKVCSSGSSGEDGGGADEPPLHPAAIADLPLVIKIPRGPEDGDDDVDDCTDAAAVLCPPTKTYVSGPPPVTGVAVTRRPNPVVRQTLVVVPAAAAPKQRRPSSASSSPSSPSSSSSSTSSSLNSSREELRHIHDDRPLSATVESSDNKSSFKADSDEDSALSSSRSSTSLQQYSPASSPVPQQPPPLPSSSPPPTGNGAANYETGKRVLKAESVEAINRKNVLCSARISSGKPEPFSAAAPAYKTEYSAPHHHYHLQQQDASKSAAAAAKSGPSFATGTAIVTRYTHNRMSSVESTTSDDSSMQYAVNAEPFGSISSLASSTSLISQQELQQLIDDANQTLEENNGGGCYGAQGTSATAVPPHSVEVTVVILHRDMATSSVGITLAGGADYETKEITVYKVLTGSPADKDGRVRKGDRILSINGKSMKGITHRESLAILKAPRSEVVLVISRCKSDTTSESVGPLQSADLMTLSKNDVIANRVFGPLTKIVLSKDGSGLGFSLEGGKNSPTGDQPLTVKKIFTGGCAEQCGQILAGDELVSVNDIDVTGMSRTEAWNLMKRLVNGTVTLCIRHVV